MTGMFWSLSFPGFDLIGPTAKFTNSTSMLFLHPLNTYCRWCVCVCLCTCACLRACASDGVRAEVPERTAEDGEGRPEQDDPGASSADDR